jgi:putative glutamine amidotransferase
MRTPVRDELLPHAEAGREEVVLGLHYMRAVERAGGVPATMAPLPAGAVADAVGRLDGLLVPGGPDVDPSLYGHEPHRELGPTFPEIDRFEIAMIREAERRGLPLLAICRGMQVLNVAHGGTLDQHLPDHPGDDVVHRRPSLDDPIPMHEVAVEPGSRLAALLGRGRAVVNSYHHQAPLEVGDGLRAVAHAPDGVIEGLEAVDGSFVVGVQWHAEAMTDRPEQAALFDALVEAAAGG